MLNTHLGSGEAAVEKTPEKPINPFSQMSDSDVDGFLADIFPPNEQLPDIQETSGLRRHYDAEVRAIRARWGDLEAIRARLGLSRRKLSQLLLVDPSAWTRWTRDGQDAPAYIYRSLEWYLNLSEKDPSQLPRPIGFGTPDIQRLVAKAVAAQKPLIIQAPPPKQDARSTVAESHLQEGVDNLRAHSKRLEQRIQEMQQIGAGWKALLILNTLAFIGAGIFLLIGE